MYRSVATATTTTRGGVATDNGDPVVSLEQIPRWSDVEQRPSSSSSPILEYEGEEDPSFSNSYFADPLTSLSGGETSSSHGMVSRFPLDYEINSKIYLWRGQPWNLEVDAVVNSSNENLDEAHSSTGLHAAAGPGLAEECATLGGCRTGMAKVTHAYDLPARRVIHTVGPKYAVKYHTAAENALSHCYRACLELLIENGLKSIAMGCIYTEAKNYPREPAAHVAIRTVRRFLEKQKDRITAVVFCTATSSDTEIYKRLLPLYFPRDKHEEEVAISKLPADVGDENGETIIDERKIRIKPLPKKNIPKPSQAPIDLPVSDVGLVRRNSSYLDSFLDPAFMSLIKDPDQRRKEQWEKSAQAQSGWNCAKFLGFGDLGGPPLSAAEEYSLHSRYLAKANSLNLSEIAEMKIVYRGGVDSEGRPVMVIVGAHFLLRCLDLERFVLYVVKEFEPLIQKPYTIVYLHSASSLQLQPDLGWMRRLQQILGRKHQRNLHAIYVLHPTFHLKAAIFALQMFVDNVVWRKVVYVDRLLQLFRYVPREQLTIPDFVFQHDLEVNGGKGLIVDPRTKYVFLSGILEQNMYISLTVVVGNNAGLQSVIGRNITQIHLLSLLETVLDEGSWNCMVNMVSFSMATPSGNNGVYGSISPGRLMGKTPRISSGIYGQRLWNHCDQSISLKGNHDALRRRRNLRVEAGWLFKGGDQELDDPVSEHSESVNEDILLFFFQLDLATRVQCALNMEQYDIAKQLRNKLTEVEAEVIRQQDPKRGSSKNEAQDKVLSIIRLRADLQNAIESENYTLAAELRDRISKLEAESLAASAKALLYESVQYAFRLGQIVRHKIFGYCAVVCGMDPVCCESNSWIEVAKVEKLPRGSNQPFYQVLVDVHADPNLLVAYVPEDNLIAPDQPDLGRFDHPYVSFLFYGMDAAGDFIPIKQLREKFNKPRHEVPIDPEDEGDG
ncbi:Macro domain-containing protein/UVR domain-containing protein/YccV-like domain-containing protein/CRAL_TRIO_2 domain-containing protein, partial [Cephalotus follicularis]